MKSRGEGGFFPLAVRALQSVHANVYGFGTISSSYPLTVRLAREVKRATRMPRSCSAARRHRAVAVENPGGVPICRCRRARRGRADPP